MKPQVETLRYLLSGASCIFSTLIEERSAGNLERQQTLWEGWLTMRHAIDYVQKTWPTPTAKIQPRKEVLAPGASVQEWHTRQQA